MMMKGLPDLEKNHMAEYGAKSILNFIMHAKEKPIAVLELWESHQKREFAQDRNRFDPRMLLTKFPVRSKTLNYMNKLP